MTNYKQAQLAGWTIKRGPNGYWYAFRGWGAAHSIFTGPSSRSREEAAERALEIEDALDVPAETGREAA